MAIFGVAVVAMMTWMMRKLWMDSFLLRYHHCLYDDDDDDDVGSLL